MLNLCNPCHFTEHYRKRRMIGCDSCASLPPVLKFYRLIKIMIIKSLFLEGQNIKTEFQENGNRVFFTILPSLSRTHTHTHTPTHTPSKHIPTHTNRCDNK